jgi:hypothetical protein
MSCPNVKKLRKFYKKEQTQQKQQMIPRLCLTLSGQLPLCHHELPNENKLTKFYKKEQTQQMIPKVLCPLP